MKKQKNIRLLLILGGLIALLTLLPYLKGTSGLRIDKRQFTLDQETVITDVILTSNDTKNKLSYNNGAWKVNDKHQLDPNMRDVFFSVLSQMEIRKAWSQTQHDSLTQLIKTKGTEVAIYNNSELVKHYYVGGNADTQISYLLDDDGDGYMIHIPGYRSYVAGIFQVPSSDWRSRRLFTAQFLNLNSLKIEYPTENIEFRYKNSFFEIIGMQADSTQLITSLENLLFLQTDQYLVSQEYVKYKVDSISTQPILATISATTLAGHTETVKVFNTPNNQRYFLGLTSDSSFCLLQKKSLLKNLVKKADFE